MRFAGQALANTGGAVLGGGLAAFGADAIVNEPINHTKNMYNIVGEAIDGDPQLGSAWNFVHGDKGLAPIEKQSMANVLTGRGRDVDISILNEAGALDRVQELMTKRPDLAENIGYLTQMEVKVNVDQIDDGISPGELDAARGAYGIPSLIAGVGAGAAGAYGANELGNRFRRK